MKKIYESHNQHYCGVGSAFGVCMGASVLWARAILVEGKYKTNPTTSDLVACKTKSRDFTRWGLDPGKRMLPMEANTKNLLRLLEEAGLEGKTIEVKPNKKRIAVRLLPHVALLTKRGVSRQFVESLKELMDDFISESEFSERLAQLVKNESERAKRAGKDAELFNKELWERSGLVSAELHRKGDPKKVLTAWVENHTIKYGHKVQNADAVVSYVSKNRGVYLLLAGSHVMAASSRAGYYFYDSQNGLFVCKSPQELCDTIRLFRMNKKRKEYEKSQMKGRAALVEPILKMRCQNKNSDQVKENSNCMDWNEKWSCIEVKKGRTKLTN